ncbi:MAG TPA: GspMb/PilO family protein [Pyrinomonadaceae bacterium]|jgi:Tfp pilus assembly protein PilO|nr:GspMb/PilO family protein [Pyrinomonadaceae bacterium]
MKEAPPIVSASRRKPFRQLLESRRNRMFGPMEILALAVSCFALLLVLLSYGYFFVPARSQLSALRADRTRLQTNLNKLKGLVNEGQNTKETVDEITTSLGHFETNNLLRQDEGRMGLYGELNRLIVKNSLRNTSGPSYTALEPLGAKVTPGTSVSTKWQSVYPGIGVLVTVEGSYQNLRHFVRDIERTRHFVVINQVELQRAENSAQLPADSETGGTRGSLVSLQLNMAMYFQREDAVAPVHARQEQ